MAPKRKKRTVTTITTMRLPAEILDRLDARADQDGISRTAVVVGLVKKHCRRRPSETTTDTPEIFD